MLVDMVTRGDRLSGSDCQGPDPAADVCMSDQTPDVFICSVEVCGCVCRGGSQGETWSSKVNMASSNPW